MKSPPGANPGKARLPAVAGSFYPADPSELRLQIEGLLNQVPNPVGPAPKAIIVPHAGYLYSGPIAASGYRQLLLRRDLIRRVVLLGPAHYEAFSGLAASSADAFVTPLGAVSVDQESRATLNQFSCVSIRDSAHAPEHCLEVQLPFLQVVLPEFRLVPLLAGDISPNELSSVLDSLWGGAETCLVISSDLSHYLDWQNARKVDQATAQAIVSLEPDRIGDRQACGCHPIRGLLGSARRHDLTARALDLRNSGDTAGPRNKVVGYGAFSFEPRGH